MVTQTIAKPRLWGHGYEWSSEEKEILKKYYNGTKASLPGLQKMLYEKSGVLRNFDTIRKMAGNLKLTILKRAKWTESEIKLLETLAGTCNSEALVNEFKNKLHSNRTPRAICGKASELGIRLLQRNDRYTLMEIAEMLGVWGKTVSMWIRTEKLVANKFTDKPISHWNITRENLRKFIIRYPTELTGRNVDMVQIVDILTELPK